MKRCSVKPYDGEEKFIFISYAHKDKAQVFPIIERLARDGYRIWYDEGIDPGSESPTIARNLNNSSACIAFISANSLDSHNCRREINFALHKKIPFVSIHLEEVTMSLGMEMQLSANQAIFKYNFSEEEFFEKIFSTKIISECKGEPNPSISVSSPEDYLKGGNGSDAFSSDRDSRPLPLPDFEEQPKPDPKPEPEPEPKPTSAPKAKRRGGGSKASIICGVILVLAVIFYVIILISGMNDDKNKIDKSNSSAAVSTSSQTESSTASSQDSSAEDKIVMSDNVYDFTIEIEGVVYKLPFEFDKLTQNGWTISEEDTNENTLIPEYDFLYVEMTKGSKTLEIVFYNGDASPKALSRCLAGGVKWYNEDVDIVLAKGITVASDADDILAAYGEPIGHSKYEEYDLITYYEETESSVKCVEIHTYHSAEDKYLSSAEIVCIVDVSVSEFQ